MGREVRRVPENWQHPKNPKTGNFIPLLGGNLQEMLREWDEGKAAWDRGEFPSYASEKSRSMTYEKWTGERPDPADYMPQWDESEKTHLMMYEDTSEGTPISPAFKTPEELARWLVDNKASAFGGQTASYEGWLNIAQGQWAPGLVVSGGQMETGVDFAAKSDREESR